MSFTESIKTCFQKYIDFNGRAWPPGILVVRPVLPYRFGGIVHSCNGGVFSDFLGVDFRPGDATPFSGGDGSTPARHQPPRVVAPVVGAPGRIHWLDTVAHILCPTRNRRSEPLRPQPIATTAAYGRIQQHPVRPPLRHAAWRLWHAATARLSRNRHRNPIRTSGGSALSAGCSCRPTRDSAPSAVRQSDVPAPTRN